MIMAFCSMAAASLAMSVGCNEFVAKPAKEEELVFLVEKYYKVLTENPDNSATN